MLLFEFVGELFQFEQREPQFDPLSQLPPKMTALFPGLPFAVRFGNPLAQDAAHFGEQHQGCFDLMRRHVANSIPREKAQPKSKH